MPCLLSTLGVPVPYIYIYVYIFTHTHICIHVYWCESWCSGAAKRFSSQKETSCFPLLNAGFKPWKSETPNRQQTECPNSVITVPVDDVIQDGCQSIIKSGSTSTDILRPKEYNNHRAYSRFAPSHWEMALLCNDVSHWLGASPESGL